jgi:uncharacterized protein YidB (DUF937 family)
MGLLDSMLGGALGAEVASVVSHAIEQHGGVSGLVAQFEKQGLGNVVHSWVGNGANLPVSTDQLHQVLGSATVQQMAAKFGLNPQVLLQQLSQHLPAAVDKLTPGGTIAQS